MHEASHAHSLLAHLPQGEQVVAGNAHGDADLLVFIDDDERPGERVGEHAGGGVPARGRGEAAPQVRGEQGEGDAHQHAERHRQRVAREAVLRGDQRHADDDQRDQPPRRGQGEQGVAKQAHGGLRDGLSLRSGRQAARDGEGAAALADEVHPGGAQQDLQVEGGAAFEDALRVLLGAEIKANIHVIFNGDGYSDEWKDEAARRGLLNLPNTLDSLERLTDDKNVYLFEKYGVLTHRELESRHEVGLDQYFKTVNIEGETTADIGRTMILPAAIRYLNELLAIAERGGAQGLDVSGVTKTLGQINDLINELNVALTHLVAQNAETGGEDLESKAHHMHDNIIPAMAAVRSAADQLEKVIPDDYWPMPTYRDMLFVK